MILNGENIGQYVSDLEDKVRGLEREIERHTNQEGRINVEKFYAAKLDIPEVARLHGVDARTVRGYVKRGLIEIHPDSTDHHTYIRASVALSLDFKKLRNPYRS